MSQTHNLALTSISGTQIPRSQRKNPGIEVFKSVLKNAGVILSTTDDPNVFTQEQALVVRDIQNQLSKLEDTETYQNFLQGLKLLCKKDKYFKRALLPSHLRKPGSDNADVEIQESLMRIFLKISQLHSEAVDVLLDQITSIAPEENQEDLPIRLLLSQLRYLPLIKDAASLSTKLLDVLEIGTLSSRMEILDAIPDIIPDSEYSETAKQLSKLLDNNNEISSAIIDCLNALNLDSDIRAQVQDHILAKILAGTSVKVFPVLLDFLMADCKGQNLNPTLVKIRSALDNIMAATDKTKEDESGKILIFSRLQIFARMRKVMSESWLQVITTIKVHTDHKPVDLLIIFMIHGTARMKKRTVETIVRKRVKDGLFRCSLLEQLFQRYLPQQLLRDYFSSIMELGCSLLRSSNDQIVVEFASTMFKLLFGHKHTQVIYRQEILDTLILTIAANDQKNVTAILKIFTDLLESEEDLPKIRHHTALLMRLLEKLDSFELKDVKVVFEILCTLTCSEDTLSGLKDEIHMIIRKQLFSSRRMLKHRGIISAVVLAKHVAITTEEQSEISISDESSLSVNSLQGAAKEAAGLLELAIKSTHNCPELLGLYYDQLAAMLIKTENLDKHFSAWLYETMTADFQTIFVTENVCAPINDLEFSMRYNLNTTDEMDAPLAVNIAELTLKPELKRISMLAPHFRLLRLLHYRQHAGDLASIDALLGCSVILPLTDNLESLGSDQIKQVADCLFYCINWFRELISGFVTQKHKVLRHKVVRRLEDLIELERLLKECMARAPSHKLPHSYFDGAAAVHKELLFKQPGSPSKRDNQQPTNARTKKPPRKKLKSVSIVAEDTTMAGPETQSTSRVGAAAVKATGKKSQDPDLHEVNFRELDTDVLRLLKYQLHMPEDSISSTDQATLDIRQLNFILKDLSTKLNLITTNKNLGLSHLTVIQPIDLVKDSVSYLPSLNRHLLVIVKKLDELLEKTDGRHDLPEMYTEEAMDVKTCFGLIVECLALLFNWSGFQHAKKIDLLRDILRSFRRIPTAATQTSQQQSPFSANRLIAELVERLCGYVDHCLHLSHAVNLVKTLEALYAITPSPEIRKKVIKASGKLLGKRWYNQKGGPEIGKYSSANVDVLVKSYLNGANVKTLCGLVATLQEQAPQLKTKEDCLHMLASIDRGNFYILYRNLWNYLYERTKIEIQSLTNNEHMVLWRTVALTMQGLMMVAKVHDSKSNLVCFLKKSIAILKVFLSHGIPIMEMMLRSKPSQVVEILKTLQQDTRFLHHLCCHSKVTKDRGIVAYVPQFRLTLETLIYRVKAVLVANGCSAAFWMGNLKNRDIHGEDILSQSTTSSSGSTAGDRESDQEDEELPEDDDSEAAEDIFNGEDGDSVTEKSSEVYD